MSNQSGKIVLILILLLLILGASIYFLPLGFKQQDYIDKTPFPSPIMNLYTDNPSGKNYVSNSFKMMIKVPDGFEVKDNFPMLTVEKEDRRIEIIRNGTNFENLEEYVEDFDKKRNVKEIGREEKMVSSYSVLSRELSYGASADEQRSVYVYTNSYVYIFSTSDEALYPVLDQIVQSFEYKP